MEISSIPVYLNICESHPGLLIGSAPYKPGFKGKVEGVVIRSIENDVIEIELPGGSTKPKIGNASKLAGISLRFCDDSVTTFGIYESIADTALGCCVCKICSDKLRHCVYGGGPLCDPGCR